MQVDQDSPLEVDETEEIDILLKVSTKEEDEAAAHAEAQALLDAKAEQAAKADSGHTGVKGDRNV